MAQRRQVQDDSREILIARICGLTRVEDSRSNINTPDAFDGSMNPFELKSATKNIVTTARDVSLTTLKSWRSKYWIVAKGTNLATGFEINALYIAHPDQLEPFFGKIEKRLKSDCNDCRQVLDAAKRSRVGEETIHRVERFLQRGITINNPKIPMRLFEGSMQLDHQNPSRVSEQIRKFVKLLPLNR